MHAKLVMAGLMGLGLFASHTALAQSSNLTNSANVVASCSVATTQNLNFGAINGLDLDSFSGRAQGMVNVKCTAGSYQVYLSNGESPITRTGNSCFQRMRGVGGSSMLVWALNTSDTYDTVYPNTVSSCPKSSMNPQVYKTLTFNSSQRELNMPVYASIQKSYMLTNAFEAVTYNDTVSVYIAF